MARRTVKVTGFRELSKALDQFKPSTGKNILRRVGREALEPFDDAWRPKAPVRPDGPERSREHMRDTGGIGSKPKRSAARRGYTVEVFAGPGPVPQAIQQEFGNRNHPAQPFARPAWEETQDQVLKNVKVGLGAEIGKAAARAGRRAAKRKKA